MRNRLGLMLVFVLVSVLPVEPCSILYPVSPVEVVHGADVIVRARNVAYARPPSNPNSWTTGRSDSLVRFEVLETLKGQAVSRAITGQTPSSC
jgi:hypothetical protein